MYFFKEKGNQTIDFTGDFILTHNNVLIKARSKSISPNEIRNGVYFDNITKRSLFTKFKITILTIMFIWGRSKALTVEHTNYKKPYHNKFKIRQDVSSTSTTTFNGGVLASSIKEVKKPMINPDKEKKANEILKKNNFTR